MIKIVGLIKLRIAAILKLSMFFMNSSF